MVCRNSCRAPSTLPEHMPQSAFDFGELELEAGGQQSRGDDAGACQQQLISHFSHYHVRRESWQRKDRGPVQDTSESLRKFSIGNRMRCDSVHRAAKRFAVDGMRNGSHSIIEGNPTHILIAAANPAAEAEFEGQEHRRESATLFAEDKADD